MKILEIDDDKITNAAKEGAKTTDLDFKVMAEKLKKEPIKRDTIITPQYYRIYPTHHSLTRLRVTERLFAFGGALHHQS